MPIYMLQDEPFSRHFEGLRPFVRQCGNDRRGRWALHDRRLLDYLMVYIKEGQGVFTLEGKSCVVNPGDFFWVPPGKLCSMESRGETMVCPFIHFDLIYRNPESHWNFIIPEHTYNLTQWDDCLHPPLPEGSAFAHMAGRYRPSQGDYICRLIEDICYDSALLRPFHQIDQTGRMYIVLAAVLRDILCNAQVDEVLAGRLHRLPDYIRDHIAEATVASCADFCALSESYFRKVFCRIFGMSPQVYITRSRMRLATEMMVDARLSISRISKACGYRSQQNFSRMFSKAMGLSPRDYRRGVQG